MGNISLLLVLIQVVFVSAFPAQENSDDHKAMMVSIPTYPPIKAVLSGTLTIPCHITYLEPVANSTVGRRVFPSTPRVKWTFISSEKEVEILVARGRKVKISEPYSLRVSLPFYAVSPTDFTLFLSQLRSTDSGIYRCDVQHGIEDDHDQVEVKVKGVVFLYREGSAKYAFTFSKAQEACARISAHIATAEQLFAAYQSGYEQCDAGWIADQTVRYPIQIPREACYGDMDGHPGVRNYGVVDPEDMYDVYCYVKELQGEVFLEAIPSKFSLQQAKERCRELGADIATTGQLYAAWNDGLDHCNPGWLADGSVRYPIITPRERCGGSSPGVKTIFLFRNQTGFPDSWTRYDVYCYREGVHSYTESPEEYEATQPEGLKDIITVTEELQELKLPEVEPENEARGAVDSVPIHEGIEGSEQENPHRFQDGRTESTPKGPLGTPPDNISDLDVQHPPTDATRASENPPGSGLGAGVSQEDIADPGSLVHQDGEEDEVQSRNVAGLGQEKSRDENEFGSTPEHSASSSNEEKVRISVDRGSLGNTQNENEGEETLQHPLQSIDIVAELSRSQEPHVNLEITEAYGPNSPTEPIEVIGSGYTEEESQANATYVQRMPAPTAPEEREVVHEAGRTASDVSSRILDLHKPEANGTSAGSPESRQRDFKTSGETATDPAFSTNHPEESGAFAAEKDSNERLATGANYTDIENFGNNQFPDNGKETSGTQDHPVTDETVKLNVRMKESHFESPGQEGDGVFSGESTSENSQTHAVPLDGLISGEAPGLTSEHSPELENTLVTSKVPEISGEFSTSGSSNPFTAVVDVMTPETQHNMNSKSHSRPTSSIGEGSGDPSGSVWFAGAGVPSGEPPTALESEATQIPFVNIQEAIVNRDDSSRHGSEYSVHSTLNPGKEPQGITNVQSSDHTAGHDDSHDSPTNGHASAIVGQPVDDDIETDINEEPTATSGSQSFTATVPSFAMFPTGGYQDPDITIPGSSGPAFRTVTPSYKSTSSSTDHSQEASSQTFEGTRLTEDPLTTARPLPMLPTERASLGASANISDYCLPNPCQNGGTCTQEGDAITCHCLPGHGGTYCESSKEECNQGWDKFQGYCYRHILTRKSWEDAETNCRDCGGHLASIMTPEEQNFINSKYKEYQWIGLNDRTIEGDFQWSDGNPLLYENWHHGQPDSYFLSGEDCVVIVWHDGGQWSDVPCNYHLSYTCKMGLVSCGPPPEVANALRFGKLKTRYEISSIVRYQCHDGFLKRRSAIIRCKADGQWEKPQLTCIPRRHRTHH